jgi:hypothetical protein
MHKFLRFATTPNFGEPGGIYVCTVVDAVAYWKAYSAAESTFPSNTVLFAEASRFSLGKLKSLHLDGLITECQEISHKGDMP